MLRCLTSSPLVRDTDFCMILSTLLSSSKRVRWCLHYAPCTPPPRAAPAAPARTRVTKTFRYPTWFAGGSARKQNLLDIRMPRITGSSRKFVVSFFNILFFCALANPATLVYQQRPNNRISTVWNNRALRGFGRKIYIEI